MIILPFTFFNRYSKDGPIWQRRRPILASAYRDHCHFSVSAAACAAFPEIGIVVSPSSANVSHNADLATVYAGVVYNTSGTEFSNSAGTNSYSVARGDWLDSGNPGDVWMDWSQTGSPHSLDTTPGTPRLQMDDVGGGAKFEITDSSYAGGAREGTYTVTFYDAATGGNNLGSATVTLTAHKEA